MPHGNFALPALSAAPVIDKSRRVHYLDNVPSCAAGYPNHRRSETGRRPSFKAYDQNKRFVARA